MEDIPVVLTRHSEQIKTLFGRMERLEGLSESINKLQLSVAETNSQVSRVCEAVETLAEKTKETDTRIDALEKAPATKWQDMTKQIISLLVAAIAGFLIKNLIP